MSLEIEHFATLCCLGLPREAALIALAAGIRDLIPSGWTRIALHDERGVVTSGYAEQGAFPALFMERFNEIAANEPSSIPALMKPAWRAAGVGWTLHKQNADYLQSGYYNEIEREVDACWLLDARKSIFWLVSGNASTTRVFFTPRDRVSSPMSANNS